MYEQILKSLENKYKHLGLGENYLKVVAKRIAKTVKEESEIEEAVSDVKDELELAQKDADQARTMKKQLDDLKKLLEAKNSGQDSGDDPKPEPEPAGGKSETTDQEPSWVQDFKKDLTALSQGLTALQAEKAARTNQEKLLAQLKKDEVPEQFYKYHVKNKTFENDTEIEEFANSLKADYDAFKQENANNGLSRVSNPLHSDSDAQTGVSSAAQAFINLSKNQNEPSKQGA